MENELLQVLDAFLAEIDESVVPASPQAAYHQQHPLHTDAEVPSTYADAFFSDVEDISVDQELHGLPTMMNITSHDVPDDPEWGMYANVPNTMMTTPVNAGITQQPEMVWTPPQAVTHIAIKPQAANGLAGSSPPRPKPMTSRKRQKQELEYLRVKVRELEEELQRLRADELASIIANTAVDDDAASSPSNDSTGALTTQDSRAVVIFWKRAALSERKATDAATEENARLKTLVEGQLEVAKSLETVLTKRPRIAETDVVPASSPPKRPSLSHRYSAGDLSVYSSLGVHLDDQYRETDAVLESCGFGPADVDVHKEAQLINDGDDFYVEHKESKLVPHDMNKIDKVVWHCLGRGSLKMSSARYQLKRMTDDTIHAKVVDVLRLPNLESNLVVRFVMKRFVEKHQIVLVWEGFIEAVGAVSVSLREKGWAKLQPHAASNQTLSQVCIRVTPVISDDGGHEEVGALTNLLVGSYHRNMGVLHQIMENLSFTEAFKATQAPVDRTD